MRTEQKENVIKSKKETCNDTFMPIQSVQTKFELNNQVLKKIRKMGNSNSNSN